MINAFSPRRAREALEKRVAEQAAAHANAALPKKYREALALMKQQGRLQDAILTQDTTTDKGIEVIERLREDNMRIGNEMEGYLKECGRIHAILNASDDYSLTIAGLTAEAVSKGIS